MVFCIFVAAILSEAGRRTVFILLVRRRRRTDRANTVRRFFGFEEFSFPFSGETFATKKEASSVSSSLDAAYFF